MVDRTPRRLTSYDSSLKSSLHDGGALSLLSNELARLVFQQFRQKPAFADELGILLMDSGGADVSERNLGLLYENRIIAFVFPAHTTTSFQALDLVFFGAMRNSTDSLANEPEVASVHGQIWKLIRVYEQTATSFTIRSRFRNAGLALNTQTRPFKLEFNKEALRQNDGFKEL
jgi:hypothetical protein